ncbi:hypothetical protein RHGRI_011125 [Rhododendron griersonianum]|uniref:Secreted protein n=1 Tax=Rhododendron griersonianum TaxID=479676 RepID=A0AAV6KKN8_9ERIC|nr:hypothetical protein RHGRI_011125 [Rhododendron griersonianum]
MWGTLGIVLLARAHLQGVFRVQEERNRGDQVTLFRTSRALSHLLIQGLREFSLNVRSCVIVVVSLVMFELNVRGVQDLALLVGSLTISRETVHRLIASRKSLIHRGNRPLE